MKTIRTFLIGMVITFSLAASLLFLHAQEAAMPVQGGAVSTVDWNTASDLQVMLQAVEMTPETSADSLPRSGNFFSAQHAPGSAQPWPPLPSSFGLPAWNLGDGFYLLDDQAVDYSLPMSSRMAGSRMSMDAPDFDDIGGGGGTNDFYSDSFNYTLPTNGLWLTITNVSNGLAWLNLHGATDSVYEVFSKTDLTASAWSIETELWPTDTNSMPFTVPMLNRTNLFVWARDWTGVTSGGNTTPDWWLWEYFGTTAMSDTNLDSIGQQVIIDYQNGIDPNIIFFSLQFPDKVRTGATNGAVVIHGGQPSYEAVLVNDTNTADAVWQPYTGTNIPVYLYSGNGTYTVSVGLRGLPTNATTTWVETQVTLFQPPALALVVTNPVSATVSTPLIQLQGVVNETLSSLTYDVSNALGVVTNQQGYWTPAFFDTNALDFTTNTFQCYDVHLTNGLNTITLHTTDLAGNSTTNSVSYTLDNSGDHTAPVLTVLWPQSGTQISGSNFTLQAQMDDATATVAATMADTNGDTNIVQGLVERNGTVWIRDLPLAAGTNILTLTATDAAGNTSTTNLTLVQSGVLVTMDTLPSSQLNQSSVNVTGTINAPGYCVWVNGIQADLDDDAGTWEADGVAVSPTGTALFDVEIYVGDPVKVGSQIFSMAQPAFVSLMSYVKHYYDNDTLYNYCGKGVVTPGKTKETANWAYASGGMDSRSYNGFNGDCAPYNYSYADSLAGGYNGYAPAWEIKDTTQNSYYPPYWVYYYYPGIWTYISAYNIGHSTTDAHARVMVVPSGQQSIGQTALYLVQAQVINEDSGLQLPGSQVQIRGQTLTDVANSDGSVWSDALVSGVAGAPLPVTPSAAGNISFNGMQAMNFRLTVVSNSAVQINGTTNWATVKTPTNDYVTVQVMVDHASDAVLAGLTNVIQWTGGMAVPGNPLQRQVSKAVSTNVIVTASLGGSVSASVKVWVIWANLTVKVSGTLDPDDKAAVLTNGCWPIPSLSSWGLGGGNGLGPIDTLSNTNLNFAFTIGRMEAKAILLPAGIGNLLPNNWDMKRTRVVIAWDNGGSYLYGSTNNAWQSQPAVYNPPPGVYDANNPTTKYLSPVNGDIFALDVPGCSIDIAGTGIFHTSEVYDNFYQYVTVNIGNVNITCSDTNFWSYEAQVDVDATNKVQLNSLTNSLITLPSSPHYTHR